MSTRCSCCAGFYSALIWLGAILQPFILLALRLLWGCMFYEAGYGKIVHIDNTTQFFASLHIPFPMANAYFVGLVEMAGGIMLALGLGARLAAIPLIATLVVAYLTAHYGAIVNFLDDPFAFTREMPFNFLLASLIIFAFGPGAFSIDALIKRWRCRSQAGDKQA